MIEEMLEKEINDYRILSNQRKKEVDNEIELLWLEMSKRYSDICNKDKEYIKTFEEIQRVHNIINYNIDLDYSDYVTNVDEDYVDDSLEFQSDIYKEHQYIAKHYDELVEKIEQKINKFKSLKHVFDRNKKIEKLEEKLAHYMSCYNFWNACQERVKLKNHYKQNYKSLVKPIEDKYNAILINHAQEVIKDMVKKNPLIIARLHDNTSRWGCLNEVQGNILNSVFNNLHNTILEGMQNKTKKVNNR